MVGMTCRLHTSKLGMRSNNPILWTVPVLLTARGSLFRLMLSRAGLGDVTLVTPPVSKFLDRAGRSGGLFD